MQRLPDERRRASTLEVWLDAEAVDELRLVAARLGFKRRVAGSKPPVHRGDLSKLLHGVLKEAADDAERWRATLSALQRSPDRDARGARVKVQMRVRASWLERIRRLAIDAGFVHGGRGNVSELLRRLLDLRFRPEPRDVTLAPAPIVPVATTTAGRRRAMTGADQAKSMAPPGRK